MIFKSLYKYRHSKENYKPNNYYQSTSLKRKRCIIDEETENLIKRFKKERDQKIHTLQTSRDINIQQSNHIDNNMKQTHDIITNINTKNIIQQTNMFSSNVLTTNLRYLLNKCIKLSIYFYFIIPKFSFWYIYGFYR